LRRGRPRRAIPKGVLRRCVFAGVRLPRSGLPCGVLAGPGLAGCVRGVRRRGAQPTAEILRRHELRSAPARQRALRALSRGATGPRLVDHDRPRLRLGTALDGLTPESTECLVHRRQPQASLVDAALIERSIGRRTALAEQRDQEMHPERRRRAHAIGDVAGSLCGMPQRILLVVGGRSRGPQKVLRPESALAQQAARPVFEHGDRREQMRGRHAFLTPMRQVHGLSLDARQFRLGFRRCHGTRPTVHQGARGANFWATSSSGYFRTPRR
jgi:hypothetical protein